jgi:hypothetical protein
MVRAWSYGVNGEALTHRKDENQCNGRDTDSRLNRVRTLDQVRSPLSSIPLPATNVPYDNDSTIPEHTEMDSTKLSDPSPPSGEPLTDHLEEQQALSAAERLLSRSLAMTCAEDGVTLNAELGGSQLFFHP